MSKFLDLQIPSKFHSRLFVGAKSGLLIQYFGALRDIPPSPLLPPSLFGGILRLSFQEGIAVHIVDQVAEAVVLTRSFQSDAADVVHSHLLHSPEDVFHSHSDPAHSFVEALIGFAQRIIAVGFAH